MKGFFKTIGGLLMIGVAGLFVYGIAIGRGWIPTPQWLNDGLSQDAGKKVVFVPSTKLSRALPGRWVAENGSLKGSHFTFTTTRRILMTIPVEGFFRDSDCTLSGTYYVLNGYLTLEMTDHDGDGCKSNIKEPDTMRDKLDMVDMNHLTLGEMNYSGPQISDQAIS